MPRTIAMNGKQDGRAQCDTSGKFAFIFERENVKNARELVIASRVQREIVKCDPEAEIVERE